MGLIYRDQGKLDKAVASLETAIRLRPDYVEAHYFHARTVLDSGHTVTGHTENKSYATTYDIDVLLSIREEIDWAIDHGATFAEPYVLAGMTELAYIAYGYHAATSSPGSQTRPEPRRDVYIKALNYFDFALKLAKPKQKGYSELRSKADFLKGFLAQNFDTDKSYIRPNPSNRPLPDYTDDAAHHKITGVILIGIQIDGHGVLGKKTVMSGLGYGLDEQAIKAVDRLKFTPATLNGKPIPVLSFVTVSFSLL